MCLSFSICCGQAACCTCGVGGALLHVPVYIMEKKIFSLFITKGRKTLQLSLLLLSYKSHIPFFFFFHLRWHGLIHGTLILWMFRSLPSDHWQLLRFLESLRMYSLVLFYILHLRAFHSNYLQYSCVWVHNLMHKKGGQDKNCPRHKTAVWTLHTYVHCT